MNNSYSEMNQGSEVTNSEAELALLRRILGILSHPMKTRIKRQLEADRKRFERSDAPGHYGWYPHKLAVCAAMERLTAGMQGPAGAQSVKAKISRT